MWFLDKGAVAQVTAFFPFVALYKPTRCDSKLAYRPPTFLRRNQLFYIFSCYARYCEKMQSFQQKMKAFCFRWSCIYKRMRLGKSRHLS